MTVSGLVDRSEFEDVRLSNGGIIRQSDRNLNQYTLRLRTAYEINPDLRPFVDVIGDTRVYDQRFDSSGVQRDSDGVGLLAGATIGFARTLTGEISAGIQHRTYADRTLRNIDAPLVNATLSWAATPLTTFRLNAATGVTETTIVGSSARADGGRDAGGPARSAAQPVHRARRIGAAQRIQEQHPSAITASRRPLAARLPLQPLADFARHVYLSAGQQHLELRELQGQHRPGRGAGEPLSRGTLFPPFGEEVAQQRGGLPLAEAAIHLRRVVAGRLVEHPRAVLHAPALRIGRPVVEPADPGE